jgi:cytochrome c55X
VLRPRSWLLVVLPLLAVCAAVAEPTQEAQLVRGWTALRAMDCARCHGRDFDGWAAPSLIAAVRDAPRERFDRWVLDGDITRGMPGYRGQALVERELDAIYAYLVARSRGEVAAGSMAKPTR